MERLQAENAQLHRQMAAELELSTRRREQVAAEQELSTQLREALTERDAKIANLADQQHSVEELTEVRRSSRR